MTVTKGYSQFHVSIIKYYACNGMLMRLFTMEILQLIKQTLKSDIYSITYDSEDLVYIISYVYLVFFSVSNHVPSTT